MIKVIFFLFIIFKLSYSVLTFIGYSDQYCNREIIVTIYYDDVEMFFNNGTHVLPLESLSNYKNEDQYEEINKCIQHKGGSMKVLQQEHKLNISNIENYNGNGNIKDLSVCVLEQNYKSVQKTGDITSKKKSSIIKYTLNNEIILYRDGHQRISCTNSHTRQYSCFKNSCILESEWKNNEKISYDDLHLLFYKS